MFLQLLRELRTQLRDHEPFRVRPNRLLQLRQEALGIIARTAKLVNAFHHLQRWRHLGLRSLNFSWRRAAAPNYDTIEAIGAMFRRFTSPRGSHAQNHETRTLNTYTKNISESNTYDVF